MATERQKFIDALKNLVKEVSFNGDYTNTYKAIIKMYDKLTPTKEEILIMAKAIREGGKVE